MKEGLTLVPIDKDDFDEVADLLGRTGDSRTGDYLLWKYEQAPPNQLLVVKDSNTSKVVGFNGLTQCSVIIEDNVYDAVQSVDTVVHPEFRRQGIMHDLCSQLYRNIRESGFDFVIGWTVRNGPAWRGLVRKLGWLDIGLMPVIAYPIRPFRAVSWLEWGRLKSLIAGALLWLRKFINHPRDTNTDDLVLEKGTWDYEGFWRCWKRSLKPGTVAMDRDPEFYRKRFSRSMWPPHEFLPITVRKHGEIVCFAVCIAYSSKKGVHGIIADLHAIEGHDVALKLLVKECIEHFEAKGADYVRGWGKKPKWVLGNLIDSGFVLRDGTQSYIMLPLSDESTFDSHVLEFSPWDLDLCDSDHV